MAGLIVQSTRAAIERANMLKGMKVTALQVTPVHYLFKPDADATIEHFRTISDATGLPILIYNVIPWNYLSVDLMLRIMDEVPGVVGMKQSGGDGAISKTVNLPPDSTSADVKAALQMAWASGCKGICVYVAGSRQTEVLTAGLGRDDGKKDAEK